MDGRGEAWRYRAHGISLASDAALRGLAQDPEPGRAPDVRVSIVAPEELDRVWGGAAGDDATWSARFPDGHRCTIERGQPGDYRVVYGEVGRFHISPGAATLLCAPLDRADPYWERIFSDTILSLLARARGLTALHAAAVDGPDGTVAILAGTGGGKTTLAAVLLARGLPLVADDVLVLEPADGTVVTQPAAPLMSLALDNAAGIRPEELGEVLEVFEGEAWIAVSRAAVAARPLAGVVMLERQPGLATAVHVHESPLPALLDNALPPRRAVERVERHFSILADVAAGVRVQVLEADVATPPDLLADLVESSLGLTAPGTRR